MRMPAPLLVAACLCAAVGASTLAATQSGPAERKPPGAAKSVRKSPPKGVAKSPRPAQLTDARLIAALQRPTQVAVAVRRLDAGSRKLNTEGWLHARTWSHPSRGLSYKVLQSGGSSRVLDKVLKPVLDAEVEHSSEPVARQTALTSDNYVFRVERQPSRVLVHLSARRQDPLLINGVATVSPKGVLQRIEGRLADRPSFWVKSVTIVREFDQVRGVTLPRSVESVADVRLAGLSRFLMTYHYESVNGVALRGALASAVARPFSLEPSSHILALYLQGT